MNPIDIASHGPVIPVIVIDRVEDALPLAEALLAGGDAAHCCCAAGH